MPCYSLLEFYSSIDLLQWFVDEKIAIAAVKDSCRLIQEEEVEVCPEKLPHATIDDNIDVYLKILPMTLCLRIVFKNSEIQDHT